MLTETLWNRAMEESEFLTLWRLEWPLPQLRQLQNLGLGRLSPALGLPKWC